MFGITNVRSCRCIYDGGWNEKKTTEMEYCVKRELKGLRREWRTRTMYRGVETDREIQNKDQRGCLRHPGLPGERVEQQQHDVL